MSPAAGDLCPVPGHGPLLLLAGGRLFCPHWSHDNDRIRRPGGSAAPPDPRSDGAAAAGRDTAADTGAEPTGAAPPR